MKYFVQSKHPDGDISGGMFAEQQIIDMFGFRDSTDCEYEVYDVTRFGDVEKLEHRQDSFREPLYHRFVSTRFGTRTIFSGFQKKAHQQGGFEMSTEKKFTVCPEIVVNLTKQDIRDIIIIALEGGIGYWACLDNTGATHNGTPISEQAADVILAGGSLTFTDAERDLEHPDTESWILTLDKLLNGIKLYFEDGCHVAVEDNAIDTCNIDANDADCIIQLGLFGEVVYG